MAVSRHKGALPRLLAAALILGSFVASVAPHSAFADGCTLPFADGDGIGGDAGRPYLVSTPEHLAQVGTACALNAHYRQTANITLPDVIAPAINNHTPIGTAGQNTEFTGVYDGDGYTISNITLSNTTEQGQNGLGFFGFIAGSAELRNVHLVNLTVLPVNQSQTDPNLGVFQTGGLVGVMINGTISDSSVTGLSLIVPNLDSHTVGGLVGEMRAGTVTRSSTRGDVAGQTQRTNYVGGLVGEQSGGSIVSSHSTATVSGKSFVGGLVGLSKASITRSYATGAVTAREFAAGGLLGFSERVSDIGSGTPSITYSYATGNVTAMTASGVGGLVGSNGGVIADSYATGQVSGGANSVGGLVGYLANDGAWTVGSITRSFATGKVTATNGGGGLVGQVSGGTVTAAFFDTDTTEQPTSAGGAGAVGLATDSMTARQTFVDANWNVVDGWEAFNAGTNDWGICPSVNGGYPYLLWQFASAAAATAQTCGGANGDGNDAAPPAVVTPAPVLTQGALPTVTPGRGVWQQPNGTPVPLTVTSPAPSQVLFTADGLSVRVIAANDTSDTAGVRVNAEESVTCEICAAMVPGTAVYVWLFSTPQLLTTLTATGTPCMTFTVPLNGATPGAHTMQLAFTTAGGVQAVNFGVTITDPSIDETDEADEADATLPSIPTGIPAGEGPAPTAPAALLSALLVAGYMVARRFAAANRG